jgi:hypothetical protein
MARPARTAMLIGAGAAVSYVLTRRWTSPQARLARMSGSSIARPDAAGWVEGAGRLLGPWFGDARADDARRGWGIAFETKAERDEPPAVPDGATPVLAVDLTTHEGHFMGSGRNRLVLFEEDGRAYVRAAGTWDPMPWHLEALYERAGRDAQHAFRGQHEIVDQSMLHQIAGRVAAAAPR